MPKTYSLLVLVLLLVTKSSAQYNSPMNNIWHFASHASIDFNSGSPVTDSSAIDAREGCASVCDTSGHLLFYTDGRKVYNRNGAIMPSGSSIVIFDTYSTTQGVLIVPVVGSPKKYYIFSLQQYETYYTGRLSYNIVDMDLDGGLGAVVNSATSFILDSTLSEKMIAIRGGNCDVWIITHKSDSSIFHAFNVSATGVHGPVISSTASVPGSYSIGVMKSSPDRSKIVMQMLPALSTGARGTQLFDFDTLTGVVSNCQIIDDTSFQYGAEFSPGSKKLYTARYQAGFLYQYDLSMPSLTAILDSRTLLNPVRFQPNSIGDMKLAPDNKIYISVSLARNIPCINAPDSAGTACNYTPVGAVLPEGSTCLLGLPNTVVSIHPSCNVTIDAVGVQSSKQGIYPNPTSGMLAIRSDSKINSVQLYDLFGRVVYSRSINSNEADVDIAHLPNGSYIVRLNGVVSGKVIKE